MNLFYRISLTAFILVVAMGFATRTTFAQTPDSLSLDEAISLVTKNNPQVTQSRENITAAQARVEQNRSGFYPQVSGDASYTYLDPLSQAAFFGTPLQFFPHSNYNADVAAQVVLYDFGKTSATVDLAASQKLSAEATSYLVQRNLAFQTIQTFYAILFLEQSIKVQDAQIANLNESLDQTKKKIQSGTATEFNALTTQVRIAAAQNQKIDLLNALQNQEIQLRELLGLPAGSRLALSGGFAYTPVDLRSDSLTAAALRERIELQLARESENAAHLQRSLAGKGDLPTLSANVAYGAKNGYFPNIDVLRGNVVATAQLSVPIFTGFRTSNQKQEAEAGIRSAEAHTIDVSRQVAADVEQSIIALRSSVDKLQNAETQVRQAREAASQAKVRYANGVITNLDLLDAQVSQAQAELTYLQSLYNYVLGSYSLKRATGVKVW